MVDFGLRANLKTTHQGQPPHIVRLNSYCGEHLTCLTSTYVLGAKPLKNFCCHFFERIISTRNRVDIFFTYRVARD